MSEYATQRAKDKIARLTGQGLDLVSFWRESTDAVASVVPHYMGPCWYTLDPASLLVTSHYQPEMPELPPEWLAHEYFEDDVHKLADVARSERGYSTVHEVTGGDPSRSKGWNLYVQPYGGDQELLVALRTRDGDLLMGMSREAVERRPSHARWRCLGHAGSLSGARQANVRARRNPVHARHLVTSG